MISPSYHKLALRSGTFCVAVSMFIVLVGTFKAQLNIWCVIFFILLTIFLIPCYIKDGVPTGLKFAAMAVFGMLGMIIGVLLLKLR